MKLKDFAIIDMGQSPKGETYNTEHKGMPFLQGRKTFGRLYPTIDTWTTSPIKIAKNGEILMSVRAPVGDLNFSNQDICIGRGLCSISAKNGRNKYLYYVLLNNMKKIRQNSTGTVFSSINKNDLENLEIDFHSDKTQRKIEKILYDIDSKIELNNEINNNLSEQIKCIYNEMFTEYDSYKRLSEISNVTIGKTPPRSESECFTTDEKDIKWISISDLGKAGMFIFDTSERLTQDAIAKYNVKIIPKNTVILSFKLTIGRTGFTTENMATNEAIAHFDLFDKNLNNYLYCTLTYFNYSDLGSTSSIATAINSKIVKSIKIGIPNEKKLNKFNELTSAMFKIIKNNEYKNIKLSELRDTLLPKLMNGEIDLDNIEI